MSTNEPFDTPEQGTEEYIAMRMASIRYHRNYLLNKFLLENNWKLERHTRELKLITLGLKSETTLSQNVVDSFHIYIQALCDMPQNITDDVIDSPVWPKEPT